MFRVVNLMVQDFACKHAIKLDGMSKENYPIHKGLKLACFNDNITPSQSKVQL